jgi:ribonuclease-3
LDAVIAAELYRRFPQMTEGGLTVARSALVRGDTLAQIAQGLSLGDQLLLGQGEEHSGGRTRASNLSAAFEAVIGAVFLDQGYEGARRAILRLFNPLLEELSPDGLPRDAKSRLQELVQRQGKPAPVYQIVQETGPDHAKRFVAEALLEDEVLGQGSGTRKVDAEEDAARAALARLQEEERSGPRFGIGAALGGAAEERGAP